MEIRDKVSASRKKGMWTGGTIPTGYDLAQHKLVPNPIEAETIRQIFRRYTELRSTDKLRLELKAKGVVSKLEDSGTLYLSLRRQEFAPSHVKRPLNSLEPRTSIAGKGAREPEAEDEAARVQRRLAAAGGAQDTRR